MGKNNKFYVVQVILPQDNFGEPNSNLITSVHSNLPDAKSFVQEVFNEDFLTDYNVGDYSYKWSQSYNEQDCLTWYYSTFEQKILPYAVIILFDSFDKSFSIFNL